jgi:hypothetical protein
MKRKSIIVLLFSIFLAVFTIAVRAERRSSGMDSSQMSSSALPLLPRLVTSPMATLFAGRQEETDLVVVGSAFLLLGILSQKRVRRVVGDS